VKRLPDTWLIHRPIAIGLLVFGLAIAQSGCDRSETDTGHGHSHGHGQGHGETAHKDDESAAQSEVVYDSGLELFVEFPDLVVDRAATFSAHISTVDGYHPADRGTVSVVLTGQSAPGERFETDEPVRDGLYQPVATPEHGGERTLFVVYRGPDETVRFSLGEVDVRDSRDHGDDHAHEQPEHSHQEHAHPEHDDGISFSKEQQWRVDFATGTVQTRELQPSVPAQGIVRSAPDATAELRAPFAGRILEPNDGLPDIGARVEAGQTLAVIAPTVDANALPMLRADLSKAKTKLERENREVERLKKLVEQGAIPKKRLLDAKSDLEAARADVDAARQRVDQYQSFDRGGRGAAIYLRSPIAGTVAERPVTSGEYVEPGDAILQVIDEHRLRLEARIAEANLPKLDRVSGVWFEPNDGDLVQLERTEQTYFARIERIDPATRTSSIWFGMPDDHDDLVAGQYHRVHLQSGTAKQTLAVPTSALIEEKGLWTAYVVAGPESFERRRVEIGMRDGDYVEIVDGLETGERIVTRGALFVKLAATTSGVGSHSH